MKRKKCQVTRREELFYYVTSGWNMTHNVHWCVTVDYRQIENGNIANQIHGFIIDYGRFILPNKLLDSIILELKSEFSDIWLVERFVLWHYIHRVALSTLVSKFAIFAISTSKHCGQLLNEVFIYSRDITPSQGYFKLWRIFKMTAVALRPKIFSRTRIQGF